MDPRDRVRPLPDGAACTACGAPIPTGRIRILARRDDLAFVELDCADCGSTSLGLVTPSMSADGAPELDVATDPAEVTRQRRGAAVRPVSAADVAAVRADLAAWDGDLVGWLATLETPGRRGTVVDR